MTNTNPAPFLSFWLLPEPRVLAHLQLLVDSLASEHGCSGFVPHLTLSSGWVNAATAEDTLSSLVADGGLDGLASRFEQHFVGDGSLLHETFGYDLFVCQESNNKLDAANARLRQIMDVSPPAWWHMSLMYKAGGLAAEQAQNVHETIKCSQWYASPFTYTDLVVIEGIAPIENQSDVADWKEVARWSIAQ